MLNQNRPGEERVGREEHMRASDSQPFVPDEELTWVPPPPPFEEPPEVQSANILMAVAIQEKKVSGLEASRFMTSFLLRNAENFLNPAAVQFNAQYKYDHLQRNLGPFQRFLETNAVIRAEIKELRKNDPSIDFKKWWYQQDYESMQRWADEYINSLGLGLESVEKSTHPEWLFIKDASGNPTLGHQHEDARPNVDYRRSDNKLRTRRAFELTFFQEVDTLKSTGKELRIEYLREWYHEEVFAQHRNPIMRLLAFLCCCFHLDALRTQAQVHIANKIAEIRAEPDSSALIR